MNAKHLTRNDLSALVPQYPSNFIHKKLAFTLAEVLITLGVIGVIAALTIPQLITNYQKHVTINKVKKFYTEMNQVMQYSIADNGEYNTWDFNLDSYGFYEKYFEKYLKKVDSVQKNIHVHCDFLGGVRVVFSDGTQMIFSSHSNYITYKESKKWNEYAPVLIFYVSAKNYENIDGLDFNPMRERFYFTINEKGTVIPPSLKDARTSNLINCKTNQVCDGDAVNNGHQECSTLIYKDGWKISSDYPW